MPPYEVGRLAGAVLDSVGSVVVGKRDALELVLAGILAGGNVLLEDLPGLGKTLTARCFAQALGIGFRRPPVTPHLSSGACSSRPTCCRPTSPARSSTTSAPTTSRSGPGRCSPTSCSPTRSTAR